MLGLLIFTSLNDLVYSHTSEDFKVIVKELAAKQNIAVLDDRNILRASTVSPSQDEDLDRNIVIHLFSPLVTSHRIMNDQFKNEYESITCEDGTIICFYKLSDYLLLAIGKENASFLQRYVQVCAKFITLLMGISVMLLKTQPNRKHMLDLLLATWRRLYQREQCFIVEGVERVIPDEIISSTTFKSLSAAAAEVCKCRNINSCHTLLLDGNRRLLGMYASEHASDLVGGDILFLNLMVESLRNEAMHINKGGSTRYCDILEIQLCTTQSHVSPHLFTVHEITPNIFLVILAETNRGNMSASLLKLAHAFETTRQDNFSQLEKIEEYMEACQTRAQKLGEDFSTNIRTVLKRVKHWWDVSKDNGILQWIKTSDLELPSRLESSLKSAFDVVLNAWESACTDVTHLLPPEVVEKAVEVLRKKSPGCNFHPAVNTSALLTPKKYMEEFPGLVHFVYLDRYLNQMTSPCLNGTVPNCPTGKPQSLTESLAVSSFRSMVSFARDHLSKGHLSLLWKDKTFSYSYFLWFEDATGNPIKPDNLDDPGLKELPIPGILVKDFYRQFVTKAFPAHDPQQVRIYELYCIHLGLATSLCILEQTRRLAATVWELSGPSVINPIDLL